MSVHRPMVITLSPVTLGVPLVYFYLTLLDSLNWHYLIVLSMLIMVFLPNTFLIYRLFRADRVARILLAAQATFLVFLAASSIMQLMGQSQDSATAVVREVPELTLNPLNVLRVIGPQLVFLIGIGLMFSPMTKEWFDRYRKLEAGDA